MSTYEESEQGHLQSEWHAGTVVGEDRQRPEYWQQKLLPFVLGLMSVLTIFFLIVSVIQVSDITRRIENAPILSVDKFLATQDNFFSTVSPAQRLTYLQWKTLAALEAHALENRYHQANVLLISRVWFGYLGFLTGLILAMVGASFILSRLREPQSKITGKAALGALNISSASPGLVLATLGIVLMMASTITQRPITVNDGPLYTTGWTAFQNGLSADSDQQILNDASRKLKKGSESH